ncbi:hypothetical protein [Thermonema rossianum]|uniref:hypothetical protein n=1 Tax=Thermonema rossianum TaxID=55505 RepID=UPI00056EF1B0|nr:hypothetical protein [Thermonema rossianum]
MKVVEVNNKALRKEFLEFPVRLYKNDPAYIRPLDKDIEEVFDPTKNKLFRGGDACRWILQDAQGQTIGCVAAFYNEKLAMKDNEQPTGGMGFFHCINDQAAANLLFDTCKAWLQARGMEAMDGPINFGTRDRWWGCLVDGFTEPNYCMPYNYPYYRTLFENYGFQTYFKQYTYYRWIPDPLKPKVHEKAKKIYDDPRYTFDHMRLSKLEKYAEDFRTIYNKAWVKHSGVEPMTTEQALTIMKKLKPILDPEIILYAYYDGEPVAFFIMLPEMNQIVKHLNGQLNWWGKLKFLWYRRVVGVKKLFGVVFGVVPEHQGKGVESAIVYYYSTMAHKPGYRYKEMEMNWIGDFNPKMMRVAEDVGGRLYKTHITYRYLFDRQKPFKRYPVIE